MIPNVMMRWCQRRAKCRWCEQEITAGEPEVHVFFWNKGGKSQAEHIAGETTRRWNIHNYYHPNCWVAQGMDYLNMNPYVPYLRKPKMELTDTERERRGQLLRKKAYLDRRKRRLKSGYPDRALFEAKIDLDIMEVALEIKGIGGIPNKWVMELRNGTEQG